MNDEVSGSSDGGSSIFPIVGAIAGCLLAVVGGVFLGRHFKSNRSDGASRPAKSLSTNPTFKAPEPPRRMSLSSTTGDSAAPEVYSAIEGECDYATLARGEQTYEAPQPEYLVPRASIRAGASDGQMYEEPMDADTAADVLYTAAMSSADTDDGYIPVGDQPEGQYTYAAPSDEATYSVASPENFQGFVDEQNAYSVASAGKHDATYSLATTSKTFGGFVDDDESIDI